MPKKNKQLGPNVCKKNRQQGATKKEHGANTRKKNKRPTANGREESKPYVSNRTHRTVDFWTQFFYDEERSILSISALVLFFRYVLHAA